MAKLPNAVRIASVVRFGGSFVVEADQVGHKGVCPMSNNTTRPMVPRTRLFGRTGRSSKAGVVFALVVCFGLVASGQFATAAKAKTKTTKTTKATKPTIAPSPTPSDANPVITEINPCPTVKATPVAAMKKRRTGDAIKVWENPDDTVQPRVTLGIGTEFNSPVVFNVLAEQEGWLNVSVPARQPNSVGWIKADEVIRYNSPFYLVLELSKRRLTVCNQGRILMQEKAGIGDPAKGETPLGTFFIVDLLKPKGGPSGPWGPYAFGLSGFSDTLFDWNGGDGRLGIHGTNNPAGLGTPVSHGCIRVSNVAITKLAKTLWLGTPVRISP